MPTITSTTTKTAIAQFKNTSCYKTHPVIFPKNMSTIRGVEIRTLCDNNMYSGRYTITYKVYDVTKQVEVYDFFAKGDLIFNCTKKW